MNLQESLRALSTDAAADDDAQVPAYVDAAVMAAWDASRADQMRTASRPWIPWAAACAAIVMTAVLVTWKPGSTAAPSRTAGAAPLIQQELVLVPELDRAGPLMLMRVRMTRRDFSRLGVPIGNPDGDGLVDVEVLVGEDGVARSIRRAVTVEWTEPNP
jgi:hypothetical protein